MLSLRDSSYRCFGTERPAAADMAAGKAAGRAVRTADLDTDHCCTAASALFCLP